MDSGGAVASLVVACAAISLVVSARAHGSLRELTAAERALRLDLALQVARLVRGGGGGGGGGGGDQQQGGGGSNSGGEVSGAPTASSISLRGHQLPRLAPLLLATFMQQPAAYSLSLLHTLHTLDLAKNQLRELPSALGELRALTALDASRNFLHRLPAALGQCARLATLIVSSNALRVSRLSLRALAGLPALRTLDLRFNNKIHDAGHVALLAAALPQLALAAAAAGGGRGALVTPRAAFHERPHAADRDGTLLASQLAPFNTATLRRRLALVFGEATDPGQVERPAVLARLLARYAALPAAAASASAAAAAAAATGEEDDDDSGGGGGGGSPPPPPGAARRAVRHVTGAPVSAALCAALLAELEAWAALGIRERPTISAAQYMILSAPGAFGAPSGASGSTSPKARAAAKKVEAHARLWALARRAMEEVDGAFAASYTAVAFTRNFVGSPHIDTQNIGPFYGLALGDFGPAAGGGGALCVECSAREVAHIDTRGRLGRADGRFPHWVAPYTGTRFSVIFYRTQGEVAPVTTAVFEGEPLVDDPPTFCRVEDRYYNCYCAATNTYSPSA